MSSENIRLIEIDRERLRADVNRALVSAYGEDRAHVMVQALEVLGTWSVDPWAHRERVRKAMRITNPKRRVEPLSSTLWLGEIPAGVIARGSECHFARDLHNVEPSFITTARRIPTETILMIERLTLVTEGNPVVSGWTLHLRRNDQRILDSVDLQSLNETGLPLPGVRFDDRDDFIMFTEFHRRRGENRMAPTPWRFGIRVDGWLAAPAYLY